MNFLHPFIPERLAGTVITVHGSEATVSLPWAGLAPVSLFGQPVLRGEVGEFLLFACGPVAIFEDGLGGWTVPGALPGSQGNVNDWERAQSIGLVDGPGVRTGHSIIWGFGLEAVDGADKRSALLRNAMRYFGALE